MQIHYDTQTAQLLVRLDGEIDHHSSNCLRSEVDAAVYAHLPQTLIFDFRDVSFMDSSGIGLIIGRCKLMTDLGGTVITVNPQPEVRKIMELAGVQRLCSIIRSERRSLIGGLTI